MKRSKVLYVEDDRVTQDIIRRYLIKLCEIDIVDNGIDALKLVKQNQYDIILMDINLKSTPNGIETAESIKEIPSYKNTPIVAVTAYAQQKDKKYFLENGLTHYISKPFGRDKFLTFIKGILEKTDSD